MKKFAVIHESDNWMMGPMMPRFNTLPEAEKYVKDFRTSSNAHSKDRAEIVEIVSKHSAHVVDQTQDRTVWGFKKDEPK